MNKLTKKEKRKIKVRAKTRGIKEKPRLSVFRSNNYIYAQLIDDSAEKTILSVSEKEVLENSAKKIDRAKKIGLALAKKALNKKIKKVVFDRGSYAYHGRVKALAEGAREGGLEF